jgi:hypothetical protein
VVGGQTQKSDNIAGKRKRVNDDTSEGSRESKMPRKAPNKAGQKPAKPTYDDPICEPTDDFFDDWESDEEDFPDFEDDDTVPGAREEEEPAFTNIFSRPSRNGTITDARLSGQPRPVQMVSLLMEGAFATLTS